MSGMAALTGEQLQWGGAALATALGLAGVAGWRAGGRSSTTPGMASGRALEKELGAKAARTGHGPRNRPRLAQRLADSGNKVDDPHQWGMFLGAVDGRALYAQHEDSMAVVAIPRTGKTMRIAVGLVLDAPGAVLATSTKADLPLRTILARARKGPVGVFDPEDVAEMPVSQQVRWDPVAGCQDPDVAIARGRAWAAAAPMKGTTNGDWFADRAATILASLLHAAALDGRTMRDVARWAARLTTSEEPVTILTHHPAAEPGWAQKLAGQIHSRSDTTAGSIETTLSGLLDPLASPRVMDSVCPGPGDVVLDVARLFRGRGTLYLLSRGGDGSAAPLVSMLADHVITAAQAMSQSEPGGRLDPPLRLVLDEAANIAPLPKLPELMADSGGRGITTCAFFQSFAQMRRRWGPDGDKEIYDSATIRLVLGGLADDEALQRLSHLCGQHRVKRVSTSRNRGGGHGSGGSSTSTHTEWEPVMRPDQIRELPDGHALMFYRSRRVARLVLRGAWQRMDWAQLETDYEAATADRASGALR